MNVDIKLHLIRVELTELMGSERINELIPRLTSIFSTRSREKIRTHLEALVLEVVEQVLESSMFAIIRVKKKESIKGNETEQLLFPALLGVINEDHLVALSLIGVKFPSSNLMGITERLGIPRDLFHPDSEILAGSDLLFEDEFDIVVNASRFEPEPLEQVDILTCKVDYEENMPEISLFLQNDLHFQEDEEHPWQLMPLPIEFIVPRDRQLTFRLFDVVVTQTREKMLISRKYLLASDLLRVGIHHDVSSNVPIVLSLLDEESEHHSSHLQFILHSTREPSLLASWK